MDFDRKIYQKWKNRVGQQLRFKNESYKHIKVGMLVDVERIIGRILLIIRRSDGSVMKTPYFECYEVKPTSVNWEQDGF